MEGLLVLGAIAGYVAIWFFLYKSTRTRLLRIGVVVIAALIPFWDLPIGYFVYQRHCVKDGGIRVYETMPPQDRVYFESTPSRFPEEMLKQGFKVIETLRVDRKGILHQELQQGVLTSRTVASPDSAVAISIERNEKLPWNIYRDQHFARSLTNNKLIATYTAFSWYGGWLQESTAPLFRGSLRCSSGPDPLVEFLRRGGQR